MHLPHLSRRVVGLCFLLCLPVLLIKLLSSRSSASILHDIVQSQIRHGAPIDLTATSSLPDLDPFNTSTYLHQTWISAESNNPISYLSHCQHQPNPFTSHIRLPRPHLNISLTPPGSDPWPGRHFNPTFLRLPSWAGTNPTANGAKYVLVTRAVTQGLHQESLICLADICQPSSDAQANGSEELKAEKRHTLPPDTRACTPSDNFLLGARGGMRCTTPPIKLNIPPTPALCCTGAWANLPHIAGFHDPRIFWSSRGEPLIILNSASQYGCVGLWLLDLRTVYPELEKVLSRDAIRKAWELPPRRYSHLTELTRIGRGEVEKNWMLFFPGFEGETVIQYDAVPTYRFSSDHHHVQENMNQSLAHTKRDTSSIHASGGRTLAKMIGAGHTTPNMTCPTEPTCFPPSSIFDTLGKEGHWHQATNALKLILCTRPQYRDGGCGRAARWVEEGREVHFSIMHRKFSNEIALPMRYERFVVVWEGRKPYRVLGVSKWPLLFQGERARPWTDGENWPEAKTGRAVGNDTAMSAVATRGARNWTGMTDWDIGREPHLDKRTAVGEGTNIPDQTKEEVGTRMEHVRSSAYFTYTPSLSWAWRPTADHFDEDDGDAEEMERLGMGFLGDDLLVGVGLDDVEQVFVRVKVDELVSCLRLCIEVDVQEQMG